MSNLPFGAEKLPVLIDHPGHNDLPGLMPKGGMSWGEETGFRKVRADLDRVIQANQVALDIPQVGEDVKAYERRIVSALAKHSPTWPSMNVAKIPDALFHDGKDPRTGKPKDGIRAEIVRDALQAPARRGELVPIKFKDAVGRTIIEYEGSMSCWMGQFRGPALATGVCIDGQPQRF